MVRNGSIEDNQYDAYLYCLDYLLELVVYFVTTFLFGLLLGYPLFGILYTLVLFSLKSCCGGIHAPSRLLCTLFSYLCFFAAFGLFSLRHQIPDTAWFFITLACCLVIFFIKDSVSVTREFTKEQKKHQAWHRRLASCICLAIFALSWWFGLDTIYPAVAVCVFIAVFSWLMGLFTTKGDTHDNIQSRDL
jgi:membrane protein